MKTMVSKQNICFSVYLPPVDPTSNSICRRRAIGHHSQSEWMHATYLMQRRNTEKDSKFADFWGAHVEVVRAKSFYVRKHASEKHELLQFRVAPRKRIGEFFEWRYVRAVVDSGDTGTHCAPKICMCLILCLHLFLTKIIYFIILLGKTRGKRSTRFTWQSMRFDVKYPNHTQSFIFF